MKMPCVAPSQPFGKSWLATAVVLAAFSIDANAQTPTTTLDTESVKTCDAPVESVLLYQGRAAVTRKASVSLAAGVWRLRFSGLPASLQPETVEARSSAGRILSVDFLAQSAVESATTAEAQAIEAEFKRIKRELAETEDSIAGLRADQRRIESIGIRTTADATAGAGTGQLDITKLDELLRWTTEQQTRLSAALRAAEQRADELRAQLAAVEVRRQRLGSMSSSAQAAEVVIAVTESTNADVRLSYLVKRAGWEPTYSVRADPIAGTVRVEFDARVVQASGEDWRGVRLALSTAQPSRAAAPPMISPWRVDVLQPVGQPGAVASRMPAVESAAVAVDAAAPDSAGQIGTAGDAIALASDARIGGGGPAMTYTISLPFDAASDSEATRRARIAAFDTKARFVYCAQPVAGDGAYLRATLVNGSSFNLLPGKCSAFVGSDFVGSAPFAGAAPNEEISVFFGIDSSVSVRREQLERVNRQSGLFGAGIDSVSSYRVSVMNGTGRTIDLELLDRRPVSGSDRIEIRLEDVGPPLSTADDYLTNFAPIGLLRWDLSVPPTRPGDSGMVVAWRTIVSRPKELDITPLP
jgi:uncharacterized protein (TIGR02231 family)